MAFGVDAAFAPHMAAAMASAVANSPGARFRFFILHSGVAEPRRALVEQIAPGARFHWIEIGDQDIPKYEKPGYLTRATLFRLGLERLAPADCHRVVYLDCDLIVMRDLRDLWRVDLSGFPIGAVPDALAFAGNLVPDFAARFALNLEDGEYVNAGVLLIDLDAVRHEKAFSRAIDFVTEHADSLSFGDQDAINFAFWGRVKLLDNEWNASRDRAIAAIASTLPAYKQLNGRPPAIIHFSHQYKPWSNNGYHPWFWIYWRYLALTPFFNEVAEDYNIGRVARLRLWLRWRRRRPPRRPQRVARR